MISRTAFMKSTADLRAFLTFVSEMEMLTSYVKMFRFFRILSKCCTSVLYFFSKHDLAKSTTALC
jgi:hypothetical protein